jgi:hypothetical protein
MSLDITTAFLLILAMVALYEIGMLARPKPVAAKAPSPQPLAPPSPTSFVAPVNPSRVVPELDPSIRYAISSTPVPDHQP